MSAIAKGRPEAIAPVEDRLVGKEAEPLKCPLFYQLSLDLLKELSDGLRPAVGHRSASGLSKNRSSKVKPLPDPQERKRGLYRKGFNMTIQKAALHVLEQLGIPSDDSLVPLIGKGEERSNFEAIVRKLNREINRAIGKDGSKSERDDWTIQEFTEALRLIQRLRNLMLEDLEHQLGVSRQLLLWDGGKHHEL